MLKGHVLQQRGVTKNKTLPLFLINLPVHFTISFFKCLHTHQSVFFLNTSCQRITMRKAYSMVIGYQFNQSTPCLWWSLLRHQKDSCQIQLESPPSSASTSHQIEDQRNETHKHLPKNNTNCIYIYTSCLSINPWCFRSYSLKATAEAQRDQYQRAVTRLNIKENGRSLLLLTLKLILHSSLGVENRNSTCKGFKIKDSSMLGIKQVKHLQSLEYEFTAREPRCGELRSFCLPYQQKGSSFCWI